MSKKEEVDVSDLMQKPKGTKVFVPDDGSVQCSRGKLGQDIFQAAPGFDLSPTPWKYTNLHEKHLRNFFSQPEKKKKLIEQGLITEDERVLCSVKEFNQYMEYLKSVNSDKALLNQETPAFERRNPDMHRSYLRKHFSQQEKKEDNEDKTHTVHSHTNTVEHEGKCDNNVNLNVLSRSPAQIKKEIEDLKLIDLEEEDEEEEENLQNEVADVSTEMSIKQKMNISALMQKPEGTKVFVPDGCSVRFSRGKLGQDLYQGAHGFHLDDPNMYRNPWKYNSLHDKHLQKFFNQPEKKKQLIEQGLITEDGNVLCSLKEFNQYIDYLKHINPKRDELPLLDIKVSGTTVEVSVTCSLKVTSPNTETTEKPAEAGLKKNNKIRAFFRKVWQTVKRTCTRGRRSKISPVC